MSPILPDFSAFDSLKAPLDLQNTSLKSSLRKILVETYSKNVLKGINRVAGRVLRVESDPSKFDYQIRNFSDNITSIPIRFKVWPESPINSIFSSNYTYVKDEGNGRIIVDSLPDACLSIDSLNAGIPAVNDSVWITFENAENFTGLTIKPMNSVGSGADENNNAGGFKTPKVLFDTPPQPPPPPAPEVKPGEKLVLTPEELAQDYKIIDYPEKFLGYSAIIKFLKDSNNTVEKEKIENLLKLQEKSKRRSGTIHAIDYYTITHPNQLWKKAFQYTQKKAKLIQTWDGNFKDNEDTKKQNLILNKVMAINAADQYKKMLQKYENDNKKGEISPLMKKLWATSVYRTLETQVGMIKERFEQDPDNQALYRLKINPDSLTKPKSVYAFAAPFMRGLSGTGHISGNAIDIYIGYKQVGKRYVSQDHVSFAEVFTFPVFKWLNDNARDFGFYPTAASGDLNQSPEAWHWEFLLDKTGEKVEKVKRTNTKEKFDKFVSNYVTNYLNTTDANEKLRIIEKCRKFWSES